MNLRQSEGAVSSQLQPQRAREREAAGRRGIKQTLSSNHRLSISPPSSQSCGPPEDRAGKEEQSRSQQEAGRSSICSGGWGGQDVVALPTNILQ